MDHGGPAWEPAGYPQTPRLPCSQAGSGSGGAGRGQGRLSGSGEAGGFDEGADLGGAGAEEAGGEDLTEGLGVVEGAGEALADEALAVGGAQEPLDLQAGVAARREDRAGRQGAGTAEGGQEGPFRAQGDA